MEKIKWQHDWYEYEAFFRPSDPSYDYQFRLIVVGDSNVGKTALLRLALRRYFICKYIVNLF